MPSRVLMLDGPRACCAALEHHCEGPVVGSRLSPAESMMSIMTQVCSGQQAAADCTSCHEDDGVLAPVEGVGFDAPDVVRLHGLERVHEIRQLPLEPARHRRELVALPDVLPAGLGGLRFEFSSSGSMCAGLTGTMTQRGREKFAWSLCTATAPRRGQPGTEGA